jgi:signal transduction histidine kinase/ligand-binding sensor domain-containing protein
VHFLKGKTSVAGGERRRILMYRVFVFAVSCCAFAQVRQGDAPVRLPIEEGTDLAFTSVPFSNGISHATVTQIVEDKTGFLWFGAKDGLRRYDGYRFRNFRPDSLNHDSLSGLIVEAVFVDRSGKLWVSSDLTLDRFDPATEIFTHYPFDAAILEGPIHDIRQDRAGMIWLATAHGLNRIDPATGAMIRHLTGPNDPSFLRSTFEEKNGTFWVASQEAVDVFDRQTGKVTQHFSLRDPVAARAGRTANLSVRLLEDHSGDVWLASDRDGLAKVDRQNNKLIYFALNSGAGPGPEPGVRAIHEDQQHALWVGTNGGGLFKLDRDRKKFVRYRNNPSDPESLSTDRILALYEDHEGAMWAGTDGGGAVRFPIRPSPFHRYRQRPDSRNGPEANYVSSAFEDSRGSIWAGGKGIVNRIDRKTRQFSSYPVGGTRGGLSNADVLSIAEDGQGRLWFATWGGGLHRLDPRTGQWKAYRHNPNDPRSLSRDSVFALLIDHRGTLWVGTEDGLDAFDPKTEQFKHYKVEALSPNRERTVAEDPQGILWLGTLYNGLHRFDPATGKFTVYRHSDAAGSLSNDAVAAICVDPSGAIWVGTANGLNRFDPASGAFTAYYEHDGLASSNVNGVLEDRGDLWVTTGDGLSHFDRQSKTFQNFYSPDGVPGDLTFAWKSRTGEMFLGSYAGLTTFYPKEVSENPYIPPVVLTSFEVSDAPARIGGDSPLRQSISLTESLTLAYQQRIFSFEFAALSYASPAQTSYRYKLEGLEDGWNEVDASKRSGRYTTLAPRDYVFRVQSRGNRGVWSDKEAAVRIRIMPPWWSTWWFRAICAAFTLATLWALYQLRVRHLAQEFNVRLEERVGERSRIARDLHDTLLQTFQGLMFHFHAAYNLLPGRPADARKRLQSALDLAAQAMTEGRDTVQALRSSVVLTNDLSRALRALGEGLAAGEANQNAPVFDVQVEGKPRNLHPILRDEIYRIAGEALRNAFRHAQARRIDVEIRYGERRLELRVQDDGKGIDAEALQHGRTGHWGLLGMRERAERIGGQFKVWSKIDAGTGIELSIPASSVYATSPARRFRLFAKKMDKNS